MKLLVTGCAGFIGMHACLRLVADGHDVTGVDNLNDYYDVSLKQARLDRLRALAGFEFEHLDVADAPGVARLFAAKRFDGAVHLAAQAGVRHSLDAPFAYVDSNVTGMLSVLEACRHHPVKHLVYASSSSVYGGNAKVPFSESDRVDDPRSLYAATKRAGELMAASYCGLYGLRATALRFFTVYGPWGRPDMAYFLFADAITQGKPIRVFNEGRMRRDFTFIDDAVEGLVRVLHLPPDSGHRILNIGNSHPEELETLIALLEAGLGRKARRELLPMQAGDVPSTHADIREMQALTGFSPRTPLAEGIAQFVKWYQGAGFAAAPADPAKSP